MKRFPLLILLVFSFLQNGKAQSDSLVLSYDTYISQVLTHHPMAKKANLALRKAAANTLGARGFLDPKIGSDFSQKQFDKKRYYRSFNADVRVPTPLGIDVVGGYENTDGVFLNPESTTDRFGLWNVGLEANILQGLWINERRTALKQAEVYKNLAQNEQQLLLNELVLEASVAYLDWQKYQTLQSVLSGNLSNSYAYFLGTREAYINGEKTTMDTLEAYIGYQDLFLLLKKNDGFLMKARQNLDNFLWENENPLFINSQTKPQPIETIFDDFSISPDIIAMAQNHPAVQASLNKFSMAEIEQRLKREKLKPKLKLKYNPLLATTSQDIRPTFSQNDYKVGFGFSMPLLFRKERADIQKGKIKMNEIRLDLESKRYQLRNKIENSVAQLTILEQQFEILNQNLEGYRMLLEGERFKFEYGESSVFLVNKRQEKYFTSQIKMIEIRYKTEIEKLMYLYYSFGFSLD